jgi:carbonic anhydrase
MSAPVRSALLISLMALSFAGCSAKKPHEAPHEATSGPPITHWTYDGNEGPTHWAQLGGPNTACATGHRQSPIDISGVTKPSTAKVVLDYRSSPATIQNNGHTIVVTPQNGGGVIVDGVHYTLKQFHFHSPSEHAISGRKTALETHFVHQDDKGNYLVISVMSDIGAADPMLGSLWTYLPFDAGQPVPLPDLLVNAQDLMPSTEDFYVYSGSLTTPPCTEAVTWMIYSSPLSVSAEQADAFERLIGPNARPLQPRNERDYIHLSGS